VAEHGLGLTAEYQFPCRSAVLGDRFTYNMTVLRMVA
jgi:hypothetical protein